MTIQLYGSSSSSSPHRVITLIVSIYSAYLPIYLSYSGGGAALVVGNDINLNSFLVYPLRHTGQLFFLLVVLLSPLYVNNNQQAPCEMMDGDR